MSYEDSLKWARSQKTSDLVQRIAEAVPDREKRSWGCDDEDTLIAMKDALDERIPVPK